MWRFPGTGLYRHGIVELAPSHCFAIIGISLESVVLSVKNIKPYNIVRKPQIILFVSLRRSLTLICGEDGEWSGPVCVQNQCPPIPALFAGAYTCSDYLYRRSTCIMSCPGDLEVI